MKTRTATGAAALSLMLALPLCAKAPASKMNPSHIGNVSSTGQSLRYTRPAKKRVTSSSPSDIRNVSRTEQSLRYKGPKQRSSPTRTKKSAMKKSR